ncbi:helix-turn-helix domain-containing protein [Variovorax sp. VNK109]|uniref:helix-turn-helix domain-containing protein n=1 Tax=Variovorax sp. VNK109 TaxID=3400919 RepID=UPI003C0CE8BE
MQKREVKPGRPRGATSFDQGVATAFGEVVREIRKTKGLSQEGLANAAGIERSHMGKIERGLHLPSLVMVMNLAEALGMRPGKIIDQTMERLVKG